MTDYKKLILGFGVKEGRAYTWDGRTGYSGPLAGLARQGCDNGADQVLIFDCSECDEDHEAVIGIMKETARTIDEPILAGGRVRRLEDVKKYLYAGASAVFLDVSREDNVDMMKEAADRFGREKVYAYLPNVSYIQDGGVRAAWGICDDCQDLCPGPVLTGTGGNRRGRT